MEMIKNIKNSEQFVKERARLVKERQERDRARAEAEALQIRDIDDCTYEELVELKPTQQRLPLTETNLQSFKQSSENRSA